MEELNDSDIFKFKRRASNWSVDEVNIYLRAWKENFHILRSMKKNCNKRPLHIAIADELKRHGYNRTISETSVKMKNILKIYRRERISVLKRGVRHSTWKYYDALDEIVKMYEALENEAFENGEDGGGAFSDYAMSCSAVQSERDLDEGEETAAATANIIRLSLPNGVSVSDSDEPFPARDDHFVAAQNEHFIPRPPTDSQPKVIVVNNSVSNGQKPKTKKSSSDNVLLGFFKEFQRANYQMEKNDALMLKLFKENNEIFKEQNELIAMLLRK